MDTFGASLVHLTDVPSGADYTLQAYFRCYTWAGSIALMGRDITSNQCMLFANANTNAVSAIAGEIWQYRTGRNLTILTKVTTLLRKADCEHFRFLQPSTRLRYNYYVQLVAIKRGRMRVANLKFWSARQRGGGSWSCTWLYLLIIA